MHIAIFGVGAMGCLFGARLTRHVDVTLIGQWPAQIRALQNGLLRITELDGSDTFVEVHATDTITGVEPADIALVLTKSPKTAAVAPQVADVLTPDGLAITLQNGLGNMAALSEHLTRVTYGITTQGATVEAAGAIRHGGQGPTHIAATPGLADLVTLLNTAGIETHISDDLQSLVWGKLAINAGINPITALLGIPNGRILESNYATGIMRDAAKEVQMVASALDIRLPYQSAADRAAEVAQATAANHSSMLQDISRGARTEIAAICGEIIEAGVKFGVPTPTNVMLYRLIKAKEDLYEDR